MARKFASLERLSKWLTRVDHISELHVYRGHQPSGTGFIMGHEFTGTVVATGPAVKSVAIGDKVVAPFTASWYVPRAFASARAHLARRGFLAC